MNFTGIQEIVIDFVCREDMVMATMKEFFEIFIASIKGDQYFHIVLMSPKFHHIGLTLEFNKVTSIATLRLILAAGIK